MTNQKDVCFIVIPGFDEDTSSVEKIRRELEQTGYTAFALNFWGEGEANFSTLTIEQSIVGIKKFIEEKSKEYKYVIGIGISLGGALLLDYAKEGKALKSIVGVGVPFRLRYKHLINLSVILFFPMLRVWWKLSRQNKKWLASDKVTKYLNGQLQKNINSIDTPVLILQSTEDFVADQRFTERYFNQISCPIKKLVFVDDVDHVLAKNEPIIFSEFTKFTRSNNTNIPV